MNTIDYQRQSPMKANISTIDFRVILVTEFVIGKHLESTLLLNLDNANRQIAALNTLL